MTSFQSDAEFKKALSELSLEQQRQIGKRFVERVVDLSDDPSMEKYLEHADAPGVSAAELMRNFNSAKSAAIETYTLCGREADWLRQASHFVAAATAACLTPPDQLEPCRNLAWTAAMNARMAQVSANIAMDREPDHSEAEWQHVMLKDFLKTLKA